MKLPREYFCKVLKEILAIDSPTGFTKRVTAKLEEYVKELGYPYYFTNKGNLIVEMSGKSDKNIGISTHVDTLGLAVRGFSSDGTLTFIRVGGAILPTLDGEYCRIYTRDGKVYTGTILSNAPAIHVHDEAQKMERKAENMHIRLDEEVKSDEDVKKLGILAGDFICYDTKTVITDNGFIKSRFLDDKLSAAISIAMLKYLKNEAITPSHNVKFLFSTYEELGHGLAHLPEGISEILAVDMGCIGTDLTCTEYDVSICAADSTGPYDYDFTSRLIELAKTAEISYAVDIYPHYGSDVSAARNAGHDVIGGLIGPGLSASHGMERSHIKACESTFELLYAYLTSP
ncbi:MAG: M42 family metallopeptidase [Turicibacter sp.]|nr:M42 family metallopeptidase [Turicibacter sp.]